jgi:hypothetical protein
VDVLLSHLASTDTLALANSEDILPGNTVRLCDELTLALDNLSETVSEHYFSHALPRIR